MKTAEQWLTLILAEPTNCAIAAEAIRQAQLEAIRAGLEAAAFRAENFPAFTHGALKPDAFEAANQAAGEIVVGIRAITPESILEAAHG